MNYWISQIIVVIAYVTIGIGFRKKERLQILLFSSIYQVLMIVHFSLLLGIAGIISGIIALLRNILFIYNEKRDKENPLSVLILFCAISVVLTAIFYKTPADILPCIMTLIGIYSYWRRNTKVTRIGNLFVSVCYIIYDISLYSWFGVICEFYLMVNTIIGYYKHEKKHNNE